MSWSADATTAGRVTAVPSLRASSATAATCGKARRCASPDPACRCSDSSSGSAATRRPALSSRPTIGRGSEGALATLVPQCRDCLLIKRVRRNPVEYVRNVRVAQLVEARDRAGWIADPNEIADSREDRRRGFPRKPAHAQQGHDPFRIAGQKLAKRDVTGDAAAPGQCLGDEVHLPFHRGARDQVIAKLALLVEKPDERGGQLLDAATRIVTRENLADCS